MKLLLTWMIIASSFAGVLANKGPLFSFPERDNLEYDQKDLIKDYLVFKAINYKHDTDKNEFLMKEAQRFIKEEKEGIRNFVLPKFHYELDFDAYPFTYGTTGSYSQYPFMKIIYGLCMGFTTALRKFHYFAYFEPELDAPYSEHDEPQKWLTYYKQKIDRIMNEEVTVIRGMNDLFELTGGQVSGQDESLRTKLKTYAMRHLTDQWAINNLNSRGLFYISKYFKGLEDKIAVEAFRKKLSAYLSRNFEPRVTWRWGESYKHIHIMRVNKVHEMNGNCFLMEYVNTDSNIMFERVCPGTKIEIAPNELARFAQYFIKYNEYCASNKSFCAEKMPSFRYSRL